MVEAIHSTYSYTFSCVYTVHVGGHIIKWVYKYIGFYGCQDLNVHRTYICIKSFWLHNHIIESNIVEQKANLDLPLQNMNVILTYMSKRYTGFKAIENIIFYVYNLIYFPCSKPTFTFVFGKTLFRTLHLFIIFVDMRKTCFRV